MSKFIKAALIRALRTTCQTLGATIPVGVVITPALLEGLDWTFLYVVGAWLLTGAFSGLASFLTSMATGLPEAEGGHEE